MDGPPERPLLALAAALAWGAPFLLLGPGWLLAITYGTTAAVASYRLHSEGRRRSFAAFMVTAAMVEAFVVPIQWLQVGA